MDRIIKNRKISFLIILTVVTFLLLILFQLLFQLKGWGDVITIESPGGIGLLFKRSGDIKAVLVNGIEIDSGGVKGGFFIYNFDGENRGWKYIPTKAEKNGGDILLTGEDRQLNFRIEAKWRIDVNNRHLILSANIKELTGKDRIAIVSYRLPINLGRWEWWYDIDTSSIIESNKNYINNGADSRYSIFPWSAVTKSQIGLSMAVPMSYPRPFRLIANKEDGLSVEFDFGFIPDSTTYPSRADFQLILYPHDPEWGFRSAAYLYYKFFPEYFKVRVKRQGLWYVSEDPFNTQRQGVFFVFNELTINQRDRDVIREFVKRDQ